MAVVAAILAVAVALRWPASSVLIVLLVAGGLSGSFAGHRIAATLEAELPVGPLEFVGVVAGDGNEMRPVAAGWREVVGPWPAWGT